MDGLLIENIIKSLVGLIEDVKQDDNYVFSDDLNTIEKSEYDPFMKPKVMYIIDNEGNKFKATFERV